MLEVCCPERLEEARAFAKTLGVEDNLQSRLDYLAAYACQDQDGHIDPKLTKCCLGADFAPHSFYFKMHRLQPDGTYKFWFDGGLIYHGPGQPGDGARRPFRSKSAVPRDRTGASTPNQKAESPARKRPGTHGG